MKSILIANGKILISQGFGPVSTYPATDRNTKRIMRLDGLKWVDWGGMYRYLPPNNAIQADGTDSADHQPTVGAISAQRKSTAA